jgi:hypothetical protein
MLDVSQVSQENVEGLQDAVANYGVTVPAGDYIVTLTLPDEAKFYHGLTQRGFPWASIKGFGARIVTLADGSDTPFAGKTLMNQPFTSCLSFLAGVFNAEERSSMALTNPQAIGSAINTIAEEGKPLTVKVDWSATDFGKRTETLLRLTEKDDIDLAYQVATKEQNAQADEAATVAKTADDFPVDPATGNRVPEKNGVRAFPFVATIYPQRLSA